MLREEKNYVEIEVEALGREFQAPGASGLEDAMERLPARYREVMLLRYQQGYDTKEMAQMMGIKRESVEKLLWRAKSRLKQIMEEG